jgi:hypothetical protein
MPTAKSLSAPPAVLVVRVLFLALAVVAVGLARHLARNRMEREAASASAPGPYFCPMHPDALSVAPGQCPICGMALTPEREGPVDDVAPVAAEDVATTTAMVVSREAVVPAWYDESGDVSSLVYRDEAALLDPDEPAQFFWRPRAPRAAGGAEPPVLPTEVEHIDAPPVAWDKETVRVRWRVPDRRRLGGGEIGWLALEPRVRTAQVVPYPAVLREPSGPYVLVLGSDGSLAQRPIETGRAFVGLIAVASGLTAEEQIVVDRAVLFDGERRLAKSRAGRPPSL